MGIGKISFRKKNCNTKEARAQKKILREQKRDEKDAKIAQMELLRKVAEEKKFQARKQRREVLSVA